MKKIISTGVLSMAMLSMLTIAPIASAQVATTTATTTESVATTTVATSTPATTSGSSRIAELMAQLAKLTELFNSLKAQMMGAQAEITGLVAEIKAGASSDDVKKVQEILAADKEIYPRGLVTGYFGPMTVEAVKRFQTKNGLEVTGEINAETRAAMDTIIEARKAEGKLPAGLMLTPGQKQKFEERLRTRCEAVTASSTAAAPCERIKIKYQFEKDEKGRVKMESKIEKKKSDDSDDEDDSDEDDDSKDDDKDNDSKDDN